MSGTRLVFAPLCYVGRGSSSRLLEQVQKHRAERILLITDPVLVKLGVAKRLADPIIRHRCIVDIFAEVEAEPTLALAQRLVEHARQGAYDLVIGLGGGSAMDLAKLAAVLSAHDGPVFDYLNLTASRTIERRGLPKLLVPTTSGTGSEVTNISVLSLDRTKDAVVHDYLLAEAAIVDPELTLSVPPRVTASTGVDALTHAIEAYLSVHASPAADALALHSVRMVGRSLRRAVHDGSDIAAREDMSQASFLAGIAFFNAGVAGVHALAYPLGGQFHIPHGESNAVMLPYVMKHIMPACRQRMCELLSALGTDSGGYTAMDTSAKKLVTALQQLIADIGLPRKLAEYGIAESDLDQLAIDAGHQKRLLARSPYPLKHEDILAIYAAALHG